MCINGNEESVLPIDFMVLHTLVSFNVVDRLNDTVDCIVARIELEPRAAWKDLRQEPRKLPFALFEHLNTRWSLLCPGAFMVDFNMYDLLMLQQCKGNNHWVLLFASVMSRTVTIYNSLGGNNKALFDFCSASSCVNERKL
ncbi:hypothetical protein DPMN_050138 [Dreissena polymorpha]|uniref:Ubiquitin-like protease family profile domain-containing protein n=1 Tax=Dreissena polymorpha TaxID=45954 RepID=A0A9D4CG68_DREPO|nr:hypothetical protein DPMN_050138 [Dreissena polymorpha]